MAESKPTKIQMAKEVEKLINAAGNMSAVMDLGPPIKTDYLFDLKNKTVTVAHLQSVITNLQADIKAVAVEIEPTDKFEKETHEVLADLKVKVPRSNPEEKGEETEEEETEVAFDDLKPEKEKPIKKEKVAKGPKKLAATTFIGQLICDNPEATFEQLKAKVDSEEYTVSDSTIRTVMSDIGKVVRYLIETGKMS